MNRAPGARLRNAAYWILPPLLCLALYERGLRAWFRADDFAWLSSGLDIHSFRDFLLVLFQPKAQGTIRPWSEPGFFIGGYKIFGLHALPFHIVVFATQFANLALVATIGHRLTGLQWAGFWAAVFWLINGSLVEPMGWTCTYNQVLCGCFLLLSFYLFLRYIETGERRYYVYQWITFLLGFGAQELNLVYPLLAMAYTALCARRFFMRALAMAPVSLLYVILHLAVAPAPRSGVYAMHFDTSILQTLATYWTWSVGPTYTYTPLRLPGWLLPAGIALVSLGLTWFLIGKLRERRGAALFCLAWYVAVIAPVLPLRDHMTEYYVFLPLIGLCWLGGWAFVEAWRTRRRALTAALGIASIYAFMAISEAWAGARWNLLLARRAHNLLDGVERARQLYPTKAILLDGVDSDLFWNAVYHQPFRLAGADQVYLTPGSVQSIGPEASSFVLPDDAAVRALSHDDLAVYDARGPRLRNVTAIYRAIPRTVKAPARVDAANPLDAYLLGAEWYPIDEDHRWMPKRATLRIAAPDRAGEKLHLTGGADPGLLEKGPVTVRVTANSTPLPPAMVRQEEFDLAFPLPDSLVGQPELTLTIEVSRTFHAASDRRELGLRFGVFSVN